MTEELSEADKSVDVPWERLEAVILDVGHGNSAVIRDGRRCLVIDVARECELIDEILRSGIKHIEHLVISHADVDHVRGALKLLPRDEISIGTVWFNPDGSKNTRLWKRFVHLVHTLYEAGKFKVFPSISVANSSDLSFGRVSVEVIHPDILFAGLGPAPGGGRRSDENNDPRITSNGMSVTLRVSLDGAPAVVFPGDLDAAGLDRILLRGKPIDAPVLVFPHHGGHCGQSSASEFTERLCTAVSAELVVVSMGRSSYENPLPEVVRSIRQTLPTARLLCTQISRQCHAGSLPLRQEHFLDKPARGRQSGSSCAGTVSVLGTADGLRVTPSTSDHRDFVANLEAPMCMHTGANIPHPRGESHRTTPQKDGNMVAWASQLAHDELAGPLPRRWAHSQGVAARASSLAAVIGQDSGLLRAAAVLHDVGYAPRLATTGFHPLDGARFLRDVHEGDERLVRLVANHSFALLEAEERGLRDELEAEFPLLEDQFLVDALVYCDMTTTPDGEPTTAQDRVAEIVSRYGADSVVGRFLRRAEPEIFAAVERVKAALAVAAQPR